METGDKERLEAGVGMKQFFGVMEMLEIGLWPELYDFIEIM